MRRTVPVMHLFCCYTAPGWFTASICFMNVIKRLQLFCVGGKCCLCVLWKVYSSVRCCWVLTRGHRISLMCLKHGEFVHRKTTVLIMGVAFLVFYHMKSFNYPHVVELASYGRKQNHNQRCNKILAWFNLQRGKWAKQQLCAQFWGLQYMFVCQQVFLWRWYLVVVYVKD